MEQLWHEDSISVVTETDFCDTFSTLGIAVKVQDQDGDRYSEFELGHAIPESPATETTEDQESDFEFGCITPGSPANDPNKNYPAPADVLFYNGRLLPHAFPFQPVKNERSDLSLLTSCTSSISSKDSLMSSRSNSSNSRSSSCCSARTSSSETSERRPSISDRMAARSPIAGERNQINRPVGSQDSQPYSTSTQRWQFIAPAPILTPSTEISRRKKTGVRVQEEPKPKKKVKDRTTGGSSFARRFFRSFVSSCRECHSLQTSMEEDR
ncbi:PREDICTED: uncharacterized protein LOC104608177 [Nelumbo nucifera]|uniref:Uncharacterized protein LOC104608177 n=2 Tax=Nelumbo nucifera TaxID=4432 RepID=A0A1U8B7X1_NELNU|nr:PREDICTED: uncharacterized protein LOC104608177 [Nelumbo nucifera]DAD21005.1 TPA_asm: hypothetical protein HUJ06_022468 [Nelumbo nucifera]